MSEPQHLTEEETAWLAIVRQHVKSLHFGVVQIVVHNDHVVQIERTEKIRLTERNNIANFDPNI